MTTEGEEVNIDFIECVLELFEYFSNTRFSPGYFYSNKHCLLLSLLYSCSTSLSFKIQSQGELLLNLFHLKQMLKGYFIRFI